MLFLKSHKWKQIFPLVTPFICIFAETSVVSFDSFLLFINLANFNFIQLVILSHFLLILSFKHW